jgi:hypothetical protein
MLSGNPREKGQSWYGGFIDFRFLGGRDSFVGR